MHAVIVLGLHDEPTEGSARRTDRERAFVVQRQIHRDRIGAANVREQSVRIARRRYQVNVEVLGALMIQLNRYVHVRNARIARNRNRGRSGLGIGWANGFGHVHARVRRAIGRNVRARMNTDAEPIRPRATRRANSNFVRSRRLDRDKKSLGIRCTAGVAIIDHQRRGGRCKRELSIVFRAVAFRIEVQAGEYRVAGIEHQRITVDVCLDRRGT